MANDHANSIWDGFPVSSGHTLIIARRHVGSLFEVTDGQARSVLPDKAAYWDKG